MDKLIPMSYLRGHRIICVEGEWYYIDTLEASAGNPRPCGYCSKKDRNDDHDPCLGILPGLMNACCGHGISKSTYIQFLDGFTIQGDDADTIINILKRQRGGVKV